MTLSRQLILLISLLVLLLFAGTFFISAYNTRDYLENQLASHAQDAATSLGLSATSHMADEDKPMVDAMVNAMIHRGDYLRIRIEGLSGKLLVERENKLLDDEVPLWFVRLFHLEPPVGEATMMSGWRQVGRVRVTSHPGLAYRKMWSTALDTLSWFVVGALLVLLLGLVALRMLLRPLQQVEEQAEAICNREFPVVAQRPFTLEFRRVVEAMNKLSARVSSMLTESERLASRLREQVYQDPVTGLANRRQFMDDLVHRVSESEMRGEVGLLMLELRDFKTYNQQYGYAAGDHLLERAASMLKDVVVEYPKSTVAHLSGASFAVLLEGCGQQQVEMLAEQSVQAISALYGELDMANADVAHVGGVVRAGQRPTAMLAEADRALRSAQRVGPNGWVVLSAEGLDRETRGAAQWRELISKGIADDLFVLLRQPVCAVGDKSLMHDELFLRLPDPDQEGEWISAGQFMPMAENTGLAAEIDRWVLGRFLDGDVAGDVAVAVNMSGASLLDAGLLEWLRNALQRTGLGGALILEWPEYGAISHVEALRRWIEQLAPLGVSFSLDHFGKGFTSFAYLRDLKVHYLKVDGSYMQSLESQPNNQFFLQALAEIARGLELQVIAESVETEGVWRMLPALGVQGARGYWLGKPQAR